MEIEFLKLSGAGNDFIVIDNREFIVPEEDRRTLFQAWCRRGLGIGADGVLLVEPADSASGAHFKMRYYNADGGEAETCGNGSRCIARFAFEKDIAPREMVFQTLAGDYAATVLESGDVNLRMSDAAGLSLDRHRVTVDGRELTVDYINTGVPHAVILVEDLTEAPVLELGRKLRHDQVFAPAGTNVNFVKINSGGEIAVRTYERGVEDETLACGTGCIASSIVASIRRNVAPPTVVITASGEKLKIGFEPTENGATHVTLEGSARIVFRGYVAV